MKYKTNTLHKLRHFFTEFYDFFRYDLSYGVQNIFYFWKVIWNFRSFDHSYTQDLLASALKRQAFYMDVFSNEVREDLEPKLEKMNIVIKNLQRFRDDSFIDDAEIELGKLFDTELEFVPIPGSDNYELKDNLTVEQSAHNSKIYQRSYVMEQEAWEETWQIIAGSHRWMENGEWKRDKEEDGSDMRGWWY